NERVHETSTDAFARLRGTASWNGEKPAPIHDMGGRDRPRSGEIREDGQPAGAIVQLVGAPDLGMAKAVGGIGELDRGEWLPLESIDQMAVAEDAVDHLLSHAEGQKLVDDDPLIVPGGEAPGFLEGGIPPSPPLVE